MFKKIELKSPLLWAIVAVAAALSFHFVADLVWLSRYDCPPSWDFANHLKKSLDYSDLAMEGRWRELVDVDEYYPPLSRLPAALAYPLFGRQEAVAVSANFVWFVIIVAAVFALGRRLGGLGAGVAGALFAAFTPFLYNYTRFYTLVVPTTAAAAAAMLALVYTDGFTRRYSSLAFGAVFGLAALVKWTVVAFVLPAAVWAVLAPGERAASRPVRLLHFGAALATAFVVACPWYLRHLLHLVNAARHTALEAVGQGDPTVFTSASFTHYISGAVYQLGIVMLAAGVIAVIYGAVRRRPGWVLLLFWIFGSYLILTLIRNKDYRFTAPMLPAFAVAFGVAFASIRPRRLQIALASLASAYALAIFFITSFGVGDLPPRYVWKPLRHRLLVYDSEKPRREYWYITAVLREVAAWERREGRRANFCVVPNVATFAGITFQYYATRDRVNANIFRPREDFPNFCDFIIAKNGDQGDDPGWKAFAKLRGDPAWFRNAYAEVGRYRLDDGSAATLYRRRVRPRAAFTPRLAEISSLAGRAYPKLLNDLRNATIEAQAAAPQKGYFGFIRVRARAAKVAGTPVADLDVLLRDVVVNPWAPDGEVQLLRLGSVSLSFKTSEEDLAEKLEDALPGLKGAAVAFDGGGLSARARYGNVPVSVTAALRDDGRKIRAQFKRASVSDVPIPAPLLWYLNTQIAPLADRERLPFGLGAVRLRDVAGGRVEVTVGEL
jgi:4-amino-4-deoxy-L-arabinose transferase-like glycosyltransferase